jgi:two-component system sensor histidine kinase HydH
VIEFEPMLAKRIDRIAHGTLLMGSILLLVLGALGVVSVRLLRSREALMQGLARDQHLRSLGEMSAVLAHEIRNPLASLKGHAQLLAERLPSDGPERRKAELVVKEAERLEALTTDLLDFARSAPVERKAVDPAALLRSCADELAAGAFVIRTDGVPATFPLDERRVRQALTNVLENARQASAPGTRPEVTASAGRGVLVVTVRDFGPGIAAGEEKRIFSPFYTTRTTGTGLGLAVALRVAEMHGGTITAENHPEGGAVFRLTFRAG